MNLMKPTTLLKLALVPLLIACAQPGNVGQAQEAQEAQAVPAPAIRPGQSFQWQLQGAIDTATPAKVVDVDLFDAPPAVIAQLKARGKRLVCYVNVGAWEDWRPDAARFPKEVIGMGYDGWAGERWLDTRQIERLAPVMRARFDLCKQKGFVGLEPDNLDGYQTDTGFPLTRADQVKYLRWLSAEARQRGLLIGLKNVPELAAELEPHFDWALTEGCFDQGWCEQLRVFRQKGKAVFMTEYTDTGVDFARACAQARAFGFTAILKNRDLGAWVRTCG